MKGCVCDNFYYRGYYEQGFSDYTGHDCSDFTCPFGAMDVAAVLPRTPCCCRDRWWFERGALCLSCTSCLLTLFASLRLARVDMPLAVVASCAGDDPKTYDQVSETQVLTCSATAGTFTLSFRQNTTTAIRFDARAMGLTNSLQLALEALSTIRNVTVSIAPPATTVCSATPSVTTITFLTGATACSVIAVCVIVCGRGWCR